jgi:ABC-type lipoprotein export system ATPase subunit
MTDNLVKINNLKKSYKYNDLNFLVLEKTKLEINEGDIVSIIGPSGVGKTTLLNIIGLLDSYDSGEYYFNKLEVLKLNNKIKNKFRNELIGFVHQFFHLIPELSVLENVSLPQMIKGISKKESTDYAKFLLETFGLKDRINFKPLYLSGGEQQRVSIARALINKPKLLIADEMTGNLDESSADEIFEFFINEIKKNKQALIYATHNIKYANIANKKLKLSHGNLIN